MRGARWLPSTRMDHMQRIPQGHGRPDLGRPVGRQLCGRRHASSSSERGCHGARPSATLGAVLAGGLGRRMGGADKALLHLGGRTLLSMAVERLDPQCDGIVISANGALERFEGMALPIVPDSVPGLLGPLAESWRRSNGPPRRGHPWNGW